MVRNLAALLLIGATLSTAPLAAYPCCCPPPVQPTPCITGYAATAAVVGAVLIGAGALLISSHGSGGRVNETPVAPLPLVLPSSPAMVHSHG